MILPLKWIKLIKTTRNTLAQSSEYFWNTIIIQNGFLIDIFGAYIPSIFGNYFNQVYRLSILSNGWNWSLFSSMFGRVVDNCSSTKTRGILLYTHVWHLNVLQQMKYTQYIITDFLFCITFNVVLKINARWPWFLHLNAKTYINVK